MSMQQMYDAQMAVTKRMVEVLESIDSKIDTLITTVNDKLNETNGLIEASAMASALGNIFSNMEVPKGLIDAILGGEDEDQEDEDVDPLYIDSLLEEADEDLYQLLTNKQIPSEVFGEKFYGYNPEFNDRVEFKFDGSKTTAVLWNNGNRFGKFASTVCMDDDVFYAEIGKIIAVRRLFDLEVPRKYTHISE